MTVPPKKKKSATRAAVSLPQPDSGFSYAISAPSPASAVRFLANNLDDRVLRNARLEKLLGARFALDLVDAVKAALAGMADELDEADGTARAAAMYDHAAKRLTVSLVAGDEKRARDVRGDDELGRFLRGDPFPDEAPADAAEASRTSGDAVVDGAVGSLRSAVAAGVRDAIYASAEVIAQAVHAGVIRANNDIETARAAAVAQIKESA